MNALEKTIVPLDNMSKDESFELMKKLKGRAKFVKIGMELFYKTGPEIIREIYEKFGMQIFLDLKLHDIPNTVSKAIFSLSNQPLKFLTLHLTGGANMLQAARTAQAEALPDTTLLGVSYLTSLDKNDFKELWNLGPTEVDNSFSNLTKLCLRSKVQGMVLSAQDLETVNRSEQEYLKLCTDEFSSPSPLVKVCPGIRFQDEIVSEQTQDQKRVATPEAAFNNGANYIVMGRSITQAKDLNGRLEQLASIQL